MKQTAIELETAIAVLKGWKSVCLEDFILIGIPPESDSQRALIPNWARKKCDCMDLILEHNIAIDFWPGDDGDNPYVGVAFLDENNDVVNDHGEGYGPGDHADKETALLFAVANIVIKKLTEEQA